MHTTNTSETKTARRPAVGADAPADSEDALTDLQRIRDIASTIKDAERDARRRFAFLRYQSAIGLGSLLVAAGVFATSGALYLAGILPAWACIIIGALATSIIREIEHDLIHNLYFRTRKWAQNAMMAAVWPFLGNLPHPWYRRDMHLLHHRTSGQMEDFEERLIGNGMPFGWKKIVAMIEPGLALLFRKREMEEIPFYDKRELNRAMIPVTWVYMVAWIGFLLGNAAALVTELLGGGLVAPLAAALGAINATAVVWVLPNVVRQVSLQILSSTMHYFEDVDTRLNETQIMNAWYLFPLNLFAFNFGSTHGVHHFVAGQTFYMRQLVAKRAHEAMLRCGVRRNDMGTILRGNRYGPIESGQ